jgi:hypothetical protein
MSRDGGEAWFAEPTATAHGQRVFRPFQAPSVSKSATFTVNLGVLLTGSYRHFIVVNGSS